MSRSKQTFNLSASSDREMKLAIQRLADASGKTAREVMVPQARLFCTDLAYNTKPIGKKAGDVTKLKADIARRIDSIYLSVGAAVNMLTSNNVSLQIFRRALRKKNFAQAAAMMSKNFPGTWSAGPFDGGRLHKEQRFSKHVRRRMVVIDKTALTAYKRQTVKMAGFAKGGFASAARQLGGVRGIPGFATKQNAPGTGRVTGDGKKLTITIINKVNYIKHALDAGGESRAIAHRVKSINKTLKRMATRKFKSTSRSLK